MIFLDRVMKYMPLLFVVLYSIPVYSISLESTIYDMEANKSFISKRIYNDSKKQNIYSISAVKIDRPGPGGEHRTPIADGELIFTPLNFSLAPGASEYFKIFYRGAQDDRERYYRIIFREMPVTLFPDRGRGKNSETIPAIAMDTILVIRPRKAKFSYMIDEKNGVLKNTGNTFFRVIVHKGCHSTDDEATIRYILPGEKYISSVVSDKNRKFIVAQKRYIPIGTGCVNDSTP